jgi:hypothetical protein
MQRPYHGDGLTCKTRWDVSTSECPNRLSLGRRQALQVMAKDTPRGVELFETANFHQGTTHQHMSKWKRVTRPAGRGNHTMPYSLCCQWGS